MPCESKARARRTAKAGTKRKRGEGKPETRPDLSKTEARARWTVKAGTKRKRGEGKPETRPDLSKTEARARRTARRAELNEPQPRKRHLNASQANQISLS